MRTSATPTWWPRYLCTLLQQLACWWTPGAPLRDLRISVTDRCNFRCNYCMPKEVFDKDYPYLPHSAAAEL